MLCITLMESKNLVGGREGNGSDGKEKFISVMQSIRVGLLPDPTGTASKLSSTVFLEDVKQGRVFTVYEKKPNNNIIGPVMPFR